MYIGLLYSKPVRDIITKEVGVYELQVVMDEKEITASRDRAGFIRVFISRALAEQIFVTGVPAEYWAFETSTELRKRLDFPAKLRFDGSLSQ